MNMMMWQNALRWVLLLWSVTFLGWLTEQPLQAQTPTNCATVTEVTPKTCSALVALYHSTNGDNWTNHSGWLTTNTPCRWYGIVCSGGLEINLANNNLVGTLPVELGDLQPFRLDLSDNQISGSIPPELGNLRGGGFVGMAQLDLSNNQLSGPIPPQLGNLSLFSEIDLSHNQLSGPIPAELARLDGQGMWPYIWLDLSHNQLNGPIPAALGQMADQAIFGISWDFSNNQLTGTLPVGLIGTTGFGSINGLDLSNNPLTGPLPADFLNSALSILRFTGTHLCEPEDSAFQSWLYRLRVLESSDQTCICDNPQLAGLSSAECDGLVDLFNYTSGATWTEHTNWLATTEPCAWQGVTCVNGAVTALELGDNGLAGRLLATLGNLTSLARLHLHNNTLNNQLPQSLTQLTQLTDFRFDGTRLCEPNNPEMQNWLAGVPSLQRTNLACHLAHFPFIQR